MDTARMIERQKAANLLLWQAALRIAGLMHIGALGSLCRVLDSYLLCLQHGADYLRDARATDSPDKWVSIYADNMTECVEKSWQDFRNSLQIVLLTQDEALIWAARIERTLAEDVKA
jgi:hypothetical protein